MTDTDTDPPASDVSGRRPWWVLAPAAALVALVVLARGVAPPPADVTFPAETTSPAETTPAPADAAAPAEAPPPDAGPPPGEAPAPPDAAGASPGRAGVPPDAAGRSPAEATAPPAPPRPPPPAAGTPPAATPDGAVAVVAENGDKAGAGADLKAPRTVAVDAHHRVFVTDTYNHRILRIDPSGEVAVVAGTGRPGYGGDGGPATDARLRRPHGIAVDGAGNVYVADSPNHRIRRIDPAGVITTVAGNGSAGFSGDGGPATEARLNRPRNVMVDPAGNVLIADTDNYRVRLVDPAGTIITIAGTGRSGASGDGGPAAGARFQDTRDVARDQAGNLYIADAVAHQVRRIDPSGTITTVAGTGQRGFSGDDGPATEARLDTPRGVAVDAAGNVFIADSSNNRIRWVDGAGTIRTLLGGSGAASGSSLRLSDPRGLNTDQTGNVYVADTGNDRILRIHPVAPEGGTAMAAEEPGGVSAAVAAPALAAAAPAARLPRWPPPPRVRRRRRPAGRTGHTR